jgi:tRNA pseudouridine38-40 synthase
VDDRFHARLSAVAKTYEYVIDNAPVADVFARKYSCRVEEPLNVDKMREAAGLLTGTHDYTSFCGNKKFKKSPVRTVTDITITEAEGKLRIAFTGDGFLQNMVRIMAGTLIEVGLGKRGASSMTAILEAKSREAAGMMAVPEGLFLKEVYYGIL